MATRRLGLILFGVAFLALFLVVAISEGVGDPSVPSGDAILVENTPGDVGEVSEDDVAHAIETTTAQSGEKPPKPGDPKYEEAKEEAEKFLLEGIWIQGVADEWDIEATDQEVAKKLKEVKKESFKSEAEFQEFLKKSHYTKVDIDNRVRIQILSEQLQEQLKEKAPKPTQDEIEDYYEAAKATQFTQKPSRDVRVILNEDQKKAQEAFDAVSSDNSAKNWSKTAKTYSEDPTKSSGGLRKEVQEGTLEEPIGAAIFGAPEGRVEGPVKVPGGYYVFEVVNSTQESTQELKAVESQIQSTLAQRLEQEYFTNFVAQFQTEWSARTFCASGYTIDRCANFEADDGHPASAPPACYEENPKGGLPEACPAPVFQLVPALPGSVTPLEPRGKPLAQRPVPLKEAGEAAAGAEALPEGVPPTGEAPPEEAPPKDAPSE